MIDSEKHDMTNSEKLVKLYEELELVKEKLWDNVLNSESANSLIDAIQLQYDILTEIDVLSRINLHG